MRHDIRTERRWLRDFLEQVRGYKKNVKSQREKAGRCKEFLGKINVKRQRQMAYDGEEGVSLCKRNQGGYKTVKPRRK